MLRLFLFTVSLSVFFTALPQRPDSVQIEGAWYFIYPLPERIEPSLIYRNKKELFEEEFDRYREWRQKSDPRAQLKTKALHAALKEELVALKRVASADAYDCQRRQFKSRIWHWKSRKSCSWRERGRRKESILFVRHAIAAHPELLVDQHITFDYDLVPCVRELPDGNYIQCFDDFYTYGKLRNSKVLPKTIACRFSLKDNQLDGDYIRYSFAGDTLRQGRFSKGIYDGQWYMTREHQSTLRRRGIGNCRIAAGVRSGSKAISVTFVQGMVDGPFVEWADGDTFRIGRYADGLPVGNWKTVDRRRISEFDLKNPLDSSYYIPWTMNLWGGDYLFSGNAGFHFAERRFDYARMNINEHRKYVRTDRKTSSLFELFGDHDDFGFQPNRFVLDTTGNRATFPDFGTYKRVIYRKTNRVEQNLVFRDDLRVIMGSRYYNNGRLFDTLWFDDRSQRFCYYLYDSRGKLFCKKEWDRDGTHASYSYYTKAVRYREEKQRYIDGFPVERAGNDYEWLSGDSLIGNRSYMYKSWSSKTNRLQSEQYLDLTTNENVYVQCNFFGEPALIRRGDREKQRELDEVKAALQNIEMGVLPFALRDSVSYRAYWLKSYLDNCEIRWGEHLSLLQTVHATTAAEIPILRQTLRWNDQPYTGPMTYTFTGRRVEYEYHVKTGLHISTISYNSWREWYGKKGAARRNQREGLPLDFDREYSNQWLVLMRRLFGDVFLDSRVSSASGNMENGKPVGAWKFYDRKHRVQFELNYSNGEPTGTVRIMATERKDSRYVVRNHRSIPALDAYAPACAKKTVYCKEQYALKNGKQNGEALTFNFRGDTMSVFHYKNGFIDGPQYWKGQDYIAYFGYKNWKPDGRFTLIQRDFASEPGARSVVRLDTIIAIGYREGLLEGDALIFEKEKMRQRFHLHNNQIDRTFLEYDKDEQLRYRVEFDGAAMARLQVFELGDVSCQYDYSPADSMTFISQGSTDEIYTFKWERLGANPNWDYNRDSETDYWERYKRGYFTKFYPNRQPAREGIRIGNKSTGLWTFYSYDGHRLYTIDYRDTIMKIDTVSYRVRGFYTEFDTLGNVVSKRIVTEESEKYNCSQAEYYAIRQYITVEDPADDKERMNGGVKNYFDNGVLMSEGLLENGKPTGVWKFYTPDGKLHRIGRYVNGLKEGRWLAGDLSDKSYIGEVCLNPDDPLLDFHVAEMERSLDIDVVIYRKGVAQAKQLYQVKGN